MSNSVFFTHEITVFVGYHTFGLQDGGTCVASAEEERSYDRFGSSTNCNNDGTGGEVSNEVYQLEFLGKSSSLAIVMDFQLFYIVNVED